jgi:hypothetical protein
MRRIISEDLLLNSNTAQVCNFLRELKRSPHAAEEEETSSWTLSKRPILTAIKTTTTSMQLSCLSLYAIGQGFAQSAEVQSRVKREATCFQALEEG